MRAKISSFNSTMQGSIREERVDLIRDLWRGDVPLVKTYWLFGVVAGIFLIFALPTSNSRVPHSPQGLALYLCLALLCSTSLTQPLYLSGYGGAPTSIKASKGTPFLLSLL